MDARRRRADITLCTATAFSKFPANATPFDALWTRWQGRDSLRKACADGVSGLPELRGLTA